MSMVNPTSGLPTKPTDPVTGKVPSKADVEKFHTNADTDGDEGSIHHTLGPRKGQAAPGDHDHRGGSSVALLQGVNITGSKSTGTQVLDSIISILVNELGATDTTTV